MNQKTWTDKNGNCKCESCGRIVAKEKLQWEKGLGYCPSCYAEIKKYNSGKSK